MVYLCTEKTVKRVRNKKKKNNEFLTYNNYQGGQIDSD